MSTKVVPSLSTIPVELLYRLLDYLDIQTILLSFQYVSKKFYLITNNSNHYNLDLSSTSKNHFDLICRLICPEKVVSITLSDENTTPGQIGLFFSLFRITDFSRLRSVTFRHIDSKALHDILTDVLCCSLTSLSFYSRGKRSKSILRLLSLLIPQSNLKTLSLNTHAHHIEGIFNSVNESSLAHLTIGILTFNEYQTILRCCPHLQTLIIDDCWMTDTDQSSSVIKSYRQVTSLMLRNTNRSMIQLESLLLLTPSLVELKLINFPSTPNSLIDGSHWETLIKTKFSFLNRFHFVFHQLFLRMYECNTDVESLLIPFRTSFWLEDKQWFVNCQSIKSSHTIKLYSIPFSLISYDYNFDPGNILLSTSIRNLNHSLIMDHVRCLSLNLTEIKTKQIQRKRDFLFCNVIELKLRFDGEWPAESLYFISMLVDLSNLQTLSFQSNFDQSIVDNLVTLVQRASNICSLILLPLGADGQYHTTMEILCSIVSSHVRHLTLKIQKLDDMKIVVERLQHLSSVSFNLPSDRKINSNEMIDWLFSNGRDFTHVDNDYSLHFWFGNNQHC